MSTSPFPEQQQKFFYFIPQGRGGCIACPNTTTLSIPQMATVGVGTHHCVTCVGVYFPMDGNKHFIAHIAARLMPPAATDEKDDKAWTPTAEQGEALAEFVKRRLAAYVGSSPHTPADDRWREKLILVCPRPDRGDQTDGTESRMTGYYVARGVLDFLGLVDTSIATGVDTSARGFIVDCMRGGTQTLSEGEAPQKYGWAEAARAPDGLGSRNIELKNGEWQIV
ncbi:hypothetical protein LTR37_017475 [Vermiconidia calcicola]|uniref:Uncharacterized protein n=1 Tax=Vermiconidia calcicola TaxID=1690605 RepID=A0ACC3MJX9_9PEZI|nr:hypothetical protein LTR37_017475 [Vermiconidia calcicola]